MEKWFEIFRTGRHTDSNGLTREWDAADLDRIVEAFNSSGQEAPIVIGHPELEAPAYGWVTRLKREGTRLLAAAGQLMPEFIELVNAGRYKKVSIGLSGSGMLSHVGFLGAMPPAVDGLSAVTFNSAGDRKMIDNEAPPAFLPESRDDNRVSASAENSASAVHAGQNVSESDTPPDSIEYKPVNDTEHGDDPRVEYPEENNSINTDSRNNETAVESLQDNDSARTFDSTPAIQPMASVLEDTLARLRFEVNSLKEQIVGFVGQLKENQADAALPTEAGKVSESEFALFNSKLEGAIISGRISPSQRDLLREFAGARQNDSAGENGSAGEMFSMLTRFIELQPEQPLFREFAAQPPKKNQNDAGDFDRARGLILESMKKINNNF